MTMWQLLVAHSNSQHSKEISVHKVVVTSILLSKVHSHVSPFAFFSTPDKQRNMGSRDGVYPQQGVKLLEPDIH